MNGGAERVPGDVAPPRVLLFSEGLAYGVVALTLAAYLSPGAGLGAFSVALSSLGIYTRALQFFARHRDRCWAPGGDPFFASLDLVFDLAAIFTGIFFANAIFAAAQNPGDLDRLFSFQFRSAFAYEMVPPQSSLGVQFLLAAASGLVMILVSMLLTAIFKEGGVALVVAWLGSLWGAGSIALGRAPALGFDAGDMVVVIGAFFFGSVGILTSSITGLFLSRGAEKYTITTPAYRGILRTSVSLIVVSVALVFLTALIAAGLGARR